MCVRVLVRQCDGRACVPTQIDYSLGEIIPPCQSQESPFCGRREVGDATREIRRDAVADAPADALADTPADTPADAATDAHATSSASCGESNSVWLACTGLAETSFAHVGSC